METAVVCPYCGEPISVWIDPSAGLTQDYVEDCPVCCHPLAISIETDEDGEMRIDARRQND